MDRGYLVEFSGTWGMPIHDRNHQRNQYRTNHRDQKIDESSAHLSSRPTTSLRGAALRRVPLEANVRLLHDCFDVITEIMRFPSPLLASYF
jgi:hypothetical protein